MKEEDLPRWFGDLLLGHAGAVEFNLALCEVLHTWDDLIDLDKPINPEDIHRAFRNALVVIPGNQFYRDNFSQLHPLMDPLILNWLTANKMESTRTQLDIAWVIRSDYCNVLLKCLQIVGGFAYARSVWPAVRASWHGEGYDTYIASLDAEQANKTEMGVPINVL